MGLVSATKDSEPCVDKCVMIMNTFKPIRLMIESWKSVSWAVNNSQNLWYTEDEVKQLWNEEQHHGLAEVAENPTYSKSHAGAIAESVSDKDLARKLVVFK